MRNKYLVLVNKKSKIRDDWEENIQLVRTKNVWSEDIKIEKETYKQYISLEKTLKEDGINIKLDSAYRSVQSQQELWDEWVNVPEKGLAYAKKFMAAPGYSEHHTGLAIDICLEKDGELVTKEYVKGRENVYIHPAIRELNNTINSANNTVATLLKILANAKVKEDSDALDEFLGK